jgi:hypothetical protein
MAARRLRLAPLFVLVAITPLRLLAGGDIVFENGFDPFYGFEIQTPDIAVAPGEEANWCYYFRSPNADAIGVKRWSSTMEGGMHHLILFETISAGAPIDRQPPGTLTKIPCGFEGSGNAYWMYAAHDASAELVLPTDDGSGTPLAAEVAPTQTFFLQMYVLNLTELPFTTSAHVKAEALAPSTPYTKTASYITTATSFSIGPGAVGQSVQNTCPTPPGVKFWWLSTRTHQYAQEAKILDGATTLLVTSDWEHPTIATYAAPDFYTFSASGLTYRCTYNNPNGFPLQPGESETSNESCIGIGYFFPATQPYFCLNSLGPS